MTDIAAEIGLGDNPQYFSQLFKKYEGITPSQFSAAPGQEDIGRPPLKQNAPVTSIAERSFHTRIQAAARDETEPETNLPSDRSGICGNGFHIRGTNAFSHRETRRERQN